MNSGKNFVTYSYDSWDAVAKDFENMCAEYGFEYLYLWDNIDFGRQNCFSVTPGKWNFYIIRWVDDGMKASLAIISPEGRQLELAANSKEYVCSVTGREINVYSGRKYSISEYTDTLKLRYSFLGEPIP